MAKTKPLRQHKKGSRLYGAYYAGADDQEIYVAYRRHKDIFRSGHSTIHAAHDAGEACWALDEETLLNLRRQGVRFVGVLEKESGDLWLTGVDRFMDRTKARMCNHMGRGGVLQRYLPLTHFQIKRGKIKL